MRTPTKYKDEAAQAQGFKDYMDAVINGDIKSILNIIRTAQNQHIGVLKAELFIGRYGVGPMALINAGYPAQDFASLSDTIQEWRIRLNHLRVSVAVPDHLRSPEEPKSAMQLEGEAMHLSAQLKYKVNIDANEWPAAAPEYASPEGWEFEKAWKCKRLRGILTIEWFIAQGTEKHLNVAQRLIEIL